MNKTLTAAIQLRLKRWANIDLAVLNMGLNFGSVAPGTKAYLLAMKEGLLSPSGYPQSKEELSAALTEEICHRLDTGEWN